MQPVNQQQNLDERYRTLLTLWFALTISIGMFFIFTFIMPPKDEENPKLSLVFLVIGVLAVTASYFVKRWFLARSVNEQDIGLVQVGLHPLAQRMQLLP